jgi:hypothetical protein
MAAVAGHSWIAFLDEVNGTVYTRSCSQTSIGVSRSRRDQGCFVFALAVAFAVAVVVAVALVVVVAFAVAVALEPLWARFESFPSAWCFGFRNWNGGPLPPSSKDSKRGTYGAQSDLT